MAASRDWMFCPQSGYLLQLDAAQGRAHCPMSGYSKQLSGAHELMLRMPISSRQLFDAAGCGAACEHICVHTFEPLACSCRETPIQAQCRPCSVGFVSRRSSGNQGCDQVRYGGEPLEKPMRARASLPSLLSLLIIHSPKGGPASHADQE